MLALQDVESGTDALAELVFARADLWWLGPLCLFLVLAFWWGNRQRGRALVALGRPSLIEPLVRSVHHSNRILSAVFCVCAFVGVAVALLRPQYGGVAKVLPSSGLDIVLAVDYSKSMLAQDVYPSRSERLEAELARFLDEAGQRGDRVGLVVFAGAARGVPLTRDTRLLKLFLERADPRQENPGGTAIGKALQQALTFLVDARTRDSGGEDGEAIEVAEVEPGQQVIVLLTDGEDNASRPTEVAKEAARLGVSIHTVGIGSTSGEPIAKYGKDGEQDGYQVDADGNYVMTRLDEATLKSLSEATKGSYVHVTPEAFGLDEVRRRIGDMSQTKRQEAIEIHRQEGYSFPLLPALVLLCLSLGLTHRRRPRREGGEA